MHDRQKQNDIEKTVQPRPQSFLMLTTYQKLKKKLWEGDWRCHFELLRNQVIVKCNGKCDASCRVLYLFLSYFDHPKKSKFFESIHLLNLIFITHFLLWNINPKYLSANAEMKFD